MRRPSTVLLSREQSLPGMFDQVACRAVPAVSPVRMSCKPLRDGDEYIYPRCTISHRRLPLFKRFSTASDQRKSCYLGAVPRASLVETTPAKQSLVAARSDIDIHSPYQLSAKQKEGYRQTGFVRLPSVFNRTTLAHYTPTMSLEVAKADKTPLESDSDYQKAFTQANFFWLSSCSH